MNIDEVELRRRWVKKSLFLISSQNWFLSSSAYLTSDIYGKNNSGEHDLHRYTTNISVHSYLLW